MVITVKSLAAGRKAVESSKACPVPAHHRPQCLCEGAEGAGGAEGLQAPPYIQEEMETQHGAETWRCPGLMESELRTEVPAARSSG